MRPETVSWCVPLCTVRLLGPDPLCWPVFGGAAGRRDGEKEKAPSHMPFLIRGEKTVFVDLCKFKCPNKCFSLT